MEYITGKTENDFSALLVSIIKAIKRGKIQNKNVILRKLQESQNKCTTPSELNSPFQSCVSTTIAYLPDNGINLSKEDIPLNVQSTFIEFISVLKIHLNDQRAEDRAANLLRGK